MAYSTTNRHLIIISGKLHDCQICAKELTANLNVLILDKPKKANQYLGQEFDAVIFNGFNFIDNKIDNSFSNKNDDFNANALGVVSGTIRAGGFLLILKPEKWPDKSLYLKRFEELLKSTRLTTCIDPKSQQYSLPIPPRKDFTKPYASIDQKQAVEAVINVVKGHRRRPLVLTADRGRGKSASLGLAAKQLLSEGYKNIIICAPSKKAANVIYQYAEADNSSLRFYSPDELDTERPTADLILIDEAAAIPLPLLVRFLKHYSRIVYSSTQHGYEGSGRGFSINFHKSLNKIAPEWKSCKLIEPVRWNQNDALEAFVFKALLLNAEPTDEKFIADAQLKHCEYTTVDKQALLKNEEQLNTLFGLLVSAHYQTKPSDLVQLLDDEAISLHTLQFKQHIIAVALLINEGGIDKETSHQIFSGNRRISGHLVAQSLAANVGIKNAPMLEGQRISRIAVHPSFQQQGYGTFLLRQIVKNSKADYLSTSFGATPLLINFWNKSGFKAVYLGMKRDASSGTHSALMLQPKTEKGMALQQNALSRFAQHFSYLLSEPFRELESDVTLALLNGVNRRTRIGLSEMSELIAFAYEQRGYENTIYPLWKLVCKKLPSTNLDESENEILLRKVLQKLSWQELAKKMNLTGKKETLALLRQAVGKLLG